MANKVFFFFASLSFVYFYINHQYQLQLVALEKLVFSSSDARLIFEGN